MRSFSFSLVLCLLASSLIAAGTVTELFISEYVEGTSNNKAIEIYNGTAGPVNAGAYRIRMYFNGSTSFTQTSLAGTIPKGGVYVFAHGGSDPAIAMHANQFSSASANWFDGNDVVALVKSDGTVVDVIGQIGNDPGSEWGLGSASTADNTLRRKSAVCGGDANGSDAFDPSAEWDGFATNTFGGLGAHSADCTVVPPEPPVPVLEIHQIQGSGAASPYAGQKVETKDNVVTAVGTNGFFLQTPDFRADANSATSNGIFVFTGSAPTVAVGNLVDVKGFVSESGGLTQFSSGSTVTLKASFFPLPASVTLAPGDSSFEPREGMLTRIDSGVAAAGTDASGATKIVAGSARPFREPGAFDGNPEIFEVDPLTGPKPTIVGGAAITAAAGPLSFASGDYVMRTTLLTFTNPPFPRAVRARNAGELTVASQNLRGASNLAALSNQIRNLLRSPDVLAVQEFVNLTTLQNLAAQVNADGGLDYVAVLSGNAGFLVRGTVAVSSVSNVLRGSYAGNGAPFPIAVIAVHEDSLTGLATTVQSLLSAEPNLRLVVTGDFGTFELSSDLIAFATSTGLTNRVLGVAQSERYSTIDNGSAQAVDHSLTSAAAAPFVRGLQFARTYADAPASASPASDHDGVVLFVLSDHDGDGLADDTDQCPTGDARATVILGSCDSGAPNLTFPGGCTLADRIAAIRTGAKNHGQFVSEVGKLLNDLMKDGLLTGAQKGAIESCAAKLK